jgi:hypothetical protein
LFGTIYLCLALLLLLLSLLKGGILEIFHSALLNVGFCSFAKKWEVFVATFALSARDRKCRDLGFLQGEIENLKVLN